MKVEQNSDSDGISVYLFPGDSLDSVPPSHAPLITPCIRKVYQNPVSYLVQARKQSSLKNLNRWLDATIKTNQWSLALHRGNPDHWTSAGFKFQNHGCRGAQIDLSEDFNQAKMPGSIADLYTLLGTVHWNGFGAAGGFNAPPHKSISNITGASFCKSKAVNPDNTYVFGSSPCGDMLIYTTDDRAGWFNHGNGEVELLGTAADTINAVFDSLNRNKSPEYGPKRRSFWPF
jgi:hypothetical protein